MSANRLLGVLLIALGAFLALVLVTDIGGEAVVAVVGIAFLAAFVATRSYGLLIPGAIVTGLGVGILVESAGGPGGTVPLGLGLGFLTIALVDVVMGLNREAWWWPLIPGGILTVVGASALSGIDDLGAYIVPAVLVLIGLVLVFGRPSRRTPPAPPTTPAPPDTSPPPTQTAPPAAPDITPPPQPTAPPVEERR